MKFARSALLVLALATVATPAHALRLEAEGFAALNRLAMGEFNAGLRRANATLGRNFPEIGFGLTGSLGARLWPAPSWAVAGHWEPLLAETESSAGGVLVVHNVNANSLQLTVAHYPFAEDRLQIGVGIGAGYYFMDGRWKAPGIPGSQPVEIRGTTAGVHLVAVADYAWSPALRLTAAAGWRQARVDDGTASGEGGGGSLRADYSGLMTRAGVAWRLVRDDR